MPERISVIVPCHDYGGVLGEAIASVDAQTRPADEIVVIDDGSTDDTAEVLRQLCRERPWLRAISHHRPTGIVRAVGDGVAASTGGLLVVLSADDRLSPTYLAASESVLERPDIDFTWTATRQFGACERWSPAVPAVSPSQMARRNRIHASGMFRRSLWERLGGYREEFETVGCEDWEFWLAALEAGATGAPVDGCHLEWRRHGGGSRNAIPVRRLWHVHRSLRHHHPDSVSRLDVLLGFPVSVAAFTAAARRTRS